MKSVIWIIVGVITVAALVSLLLWGRMPSVSEARADFCTNLGAYGEAVVNLRSINEDSTVQELKDARQAVDESWAELQASASTLQRAKLNELEASYNELGNTIKNIPDDATLAEARADVYRAALNTLAQALTVNGVTCKFGGTAAGTPQPQR